LHVRIQRVQNPARKPVRDLSGRRICTPDRVERIRRNDGHGPRRRLPDLDQLLRSRADRATHLRRRTRRRRPQRTVLDLGRRQIDASGSAQRRWRRRGEGSFRHELELEQINDAGEAAGTSTVNVVFGEGESSEDRPVIYSPSGVGREVALFQDTITDDEDEQIPVGGLGIGIDDNGDTVGIGVRQIGGKVRGRGFFAPAGSSPEVVGEADAPEGSLWFSEIFEVNASGTMFGQLTTTEENEEEEEEEEIPTGTKYYLWETPSSHGIPINFDEIVRGLANDGTVLRRRGGTLFMRTPDGKEVAVEGLDKPEAVNSAHQIAGSEIVKGVEHAAVWQSGKVTDLNTLLPENSGWVLQRAATINDSGDIAGIGLHEGHAAAFLMPAVKTSEELEVTSVEDTTTGLDSGSILGGDTLKIKGSGFGAPQGGKTMVAFSIGGEQLGKFEASTVSAKEVTVPAPDLASFTSKIPADKEGLPLDVNVITSSGAKEVHSKTVAGDAFEALLPKVDSVQDTDTKELVGSSPWWGDPRDQRIRVQRPSRRVSIGPSTGSKFTSVNFKICGVEAGASVQWWDPSTHTWQAASSQTDPTGEPPCVTVTVDSGFTTKSNPKLSLAAPVKFTAGAARVSLQCSSGSGHCPTVTLQLTVTEHLHDHRVSAITAGSTTRKVVIGQIKVALAAGQSKVVTLSLNSAGKRLLKTHRSFKAHLAVRAENAIVKAQTVTITRKTKG
jgi:hypothetical protein